MASNPFNPGFGHVPARVAGRAAIQADLRQALEVGRDDPNLCTLLVGPRGTGKTALLNLSLRWAQELDWAVASVTTGPDMLQQVIEQTMLAVQKLPHVDGVKVKTPVVEVSLTGGLAETGTWRTRMSLLLDALNAKGRGLLICVDEVLAQDPTLVSLVADYQQLSASEGKKVALFMAGLPDNVRGVKKDKIASFLRRARMQQLGAIPSGDVREAMTLSFADSGQTIEPRALDVKKDKIASFLRRARMQQLGAIPSGDVREAMTLSFADSGQTIEPRALDSMVTAIDGYPYLFQLVGYYTWRYAQGAGVVTAQHAGPGIESARDEMRETVIDATLADLSDGDLSFLAAMLPDQETSTLKDLGQRLGRSSGHVSTYKKRLLRAGVLTTVGRGRVRFALPGLREALEEES